MARNSLGKGLDTDAFGGAGLAALLGEDTEEAAAGVTTLPIEKIEPRPDQPRYLFDQEKLYELADSIRQHGMIQPITVRQMLSGYYEIVAGERRWRAARLAELREVPAIVIEADDQKAAELALIENLQREDLNPVEEARGYKTLLDNYGMTQQQAADTVGRSRPVIANAIRLLALPEDVLAMMEAKKLTLSHARILLELKNPEDQSAAAVTVVDNELSVKETEALVKRVASGNTKKKPKTRPVGADGVDYYAEVEKELTRNMGRRVTISAGAKKGKFEIEYYGSEDFEIVYEALKQLRKGGGGQ